MSASNSAQKVLGAEIPKLMHCENNHLSSEQIPDAFARHLKNKVKDILVYQKTALKSGK